MKISNYFQTIAKAFVGVLILSVVLAACSKDKSEPLRLAGIAFVNASPDTTKYGIYVNGQLANPNSLFFYKKKYDYAGLYPGLIRIDIAKKGSNTSLLSREDVYLSGKAYSFFVADTGSKRTLLKIEDDLTAPETDKAKVRFVNLSPGSTGLNLAINGKDADLFTNKLFKESTLFTSVDPGESVTFNIKDNATKAVTATVANVKIEKGKLYTIWARGLNNPAVADSLKFGGSIYTH